MAKYIQMPKLSDTMTEGVLLKWRVEEGQKVTFGDILAEVETDKATMEMEAFDDGVIYKLLAGEGDKVAINGNLGIVLAEGEEAPADGEELEIEGGAAEAAPAAEDTKDGKPGKERTSRSNRPKSRRGGRSRKSSSGATPDNASVKASPLARKVADELGVNLVNVTGTGPGGRIVKADVETAPKGGASAGGGSSVASAPTIRPEMVEGAERVALTGMRTVIAERLLASKTQIPHFYLHIEVDAAPLMALRKQINEGSLSTGGNKYTVNDFILKAVIGAAVAVPDVNAAWDGDAIIKYPDVNLSVAIAVEDGLVTPVIRGSQGLSMLKISESVKDLAERARNKKLSPDEFSGGTITVSNLGSYGIDSFDAIINPPQASIISVGGAVKKPVVNDKGEIVPGLRMNLGMSCDHRVVDGAVAATYLAELRKLIENPALMIV